MKNSMFEMRVSFKNATSEQVTVLENSGFNVINPTVSDERERLKGLENKTLFNGDVSVMNFQIHNLCEIVAKFQAEL